MPRRFFLERIAASIVGVAHCIAIDVVAMGSCTRELYPRVRCLDIFTHRPVAGDERHLSRELNRRYGAAINRSVRLLQHPRRLWGQSAAAPARVPPAARACR